MRRSTRLVIPAICLLWLVPSAPGQQRFPPPEFEGDYRMPETTTPPPRAQWRQVVDLGALVVALAAGAVLTLRVRRRGPIVALSIVCLAYFGFYRGGCVCPIGAIQNVAMAVFGAPYTVPWVVVGFFVLPLVAALLFGRTFCSAICPLGTVQDLVVLKPLRVPAWIDKPLSLLAWAYLAAAVVLAVTGSAMLICRYDPFVAIFRLVPVGTVLDAWARGDPALNPWAISGRIDTLLLGGSFLLIGLFIARPYCRYFCPYGVLLGLLSRLSVWRVTVTPTQCIQCRLCENACPVGAIRTPTAEAPGHLRTRGKAALALTLVLAGPIVLAAAWLGGQTGPTLAQLHPTVALAERIRLENAGAVEGTTDESDAFRATGRSADDLYGESDAIVGQFVGKWLAAGVPFGMAHLMGAFVGVVIALKLLAASIRRSRSDYEPDRADCVACGRCFAYCPVEQARRNGTTVTIVEEEV